MIARYFTTSALFWSHASDWLTFGLEVVCCLHRNCFPNPHRNLKLHTCVFEPNHCKLMRCMVSLIKSSWLRNSLFCIFLDHRLRMQWRDWKVNAHLNINWFRKNERKIKQNHFVNKAIQKQTRLDGEKNCIMMNALRLSLLFFWLFLFLKSASCWQKNKASKKTKARKQTILMITWRINDLFIIWNQPRWSIFLLSMFEWVFSLFAIIFWWTCFDPKEKKWETRWRIFFSLCHDTNCTESEFINLKLKKLENIFRLFLAVLAWRVFLLSLNEKYCQKTKVIFYVSLCTFVGFAPQNSWSSLLKPSSQNPFMVIKPELEFI